MNGLITLAIVLAGITGYLFAGWRIAVAQLPVSWAKARKEWISDDNRRESVRGQTVCLFLFWPLVMGIRALTVRLDRAIDAGDPEALRRKVAEQKAYIAQLEREAGIR